MQPLLVAQVAVDVREEVLNRIEVRGFGRVAVERGEAKPVERGASDPGRVLLRTIMQTVDAREANCPDGVRGERADLLKDFDVRSSGEPLVALKLLYLTEH